MKQKRHISPFRTFFKTVDYNDSGKEEIKILRKHFKSTGINIVARGRNPDRKQFVGQKGKYGAYDLVTLRQSIPLRFAKTVDLYICKNR